MLTKRRQEFLKAVVELHSTTGEPVHYTKVAEVLGVSPWTAYDILTFLAEKGYLEVVHQVDRAEETPGRSKVKFKPTLLAFNALNSCSKKDWENIRMELFERLKEAELKGAKAIVKDTLGELSRVSNPLIFCAKLLLALILALWTIRKAAQTLFVVREVLTSFNTTETALLLLAGLVLGYIWKSGKKELGKAFNGHIVRYVNEVKRLGEEDREKLLNFVRDITLVSPSPS
ncbi:MAG: hypothetical protein RMK30_08560 [Anaerolineae bacterium]|nr:hypothetical protein [Anaerolineae bacterium]MDW8102912.1 hypothetical protein [Anaerolineae bacterium]